MVSVIIPTHNRPELLCEALRSVLAQTMQEFEVIVVNDAGVDVRPWVRSVEDSGRFRILQNVQNQGLPAARNIGIRASRGKYIAYLDDDDQFYPHHLAVLVEAAETSGLALVYSDGCQALHYDCDGQTVIERSLVYPGNFELSDLLVSTQFPVNCVLHLRSCIDKVGGFDESLGSHEDWDMWVRLFHNFQYSHVRQTTCEYRIQRDRVSITNNKRLDFYHTMKTIHRRHLCLSPSRAITRKLQKNALRTLSSELYRSGKPVEPWDKLRFMLRREDAALRAKGMVKRMLSLVRHGHSSSMNKT
jgi:glycosyltransferase involved in cell wall biosynthesis